MRVLLVRGDSGGCAFYRMELPAVMSERAHLPVGISDGLPAKETKHGRKVDFDLLSEKYDVVVIQRPLLHQIVRAIRPMQERGITVVVEVDDDFTAIHRDNQAYTRTDPHNKKTPYDRTRVSAACAIADLVTVSTPALADVYAKHGRYAVVPNCVPNFLATWGGRKLPGSCGWAGAIHTHPHDLQQTGGGIPQALADAHAGFLVVGQSEGVGKALGLPRQPPETGWLPISDYYAELCRLEVGIVPLEDSKFNRAKSNLKGLEYAACGVAFVASSLPEYVTLHARGAGVLATTADDWRREVARLLKDRELREYHTLRARQVIRDSYTLEKNWHRWPEAWEKAWKYRRTLHTSG